jgi:branched-subunit amino acid ABC-type transport system permease component
MEGLISLEFLSEQVDAVLKAWAIVIPLVVLLLWVAWKSRGIFKA